MTNLERVDLNFSFRSKSPVVEGWVDCVDFNRGVSNSEEKKMIENLFLHAVENTTPIRITDENREIITIELSKLKPESIKEIEELMQTIPQDCTLALAGGKNGRYFTAVVIFPQDKQSNTRMLVLSK